MTAPSCEAFESFACIEVSEDTTVTAGLIYIVVISDKKGSTS